MNYIESGTQVFKFLNPKSEYFWPTIIDVLVNKRIYLSSREHFNDPYDSRPVIEGELSQIDVQKYADLMFANPWSKGRDTDTIIEILKRQDAIQPKLSQKQVTEISRNMRDTVDDFIDRCGISCFSLTASQPLLWAHYAAGFSGVCLAFKWSGSKSSAFSVCAKVEYVDQRPRMPISLIHALALARQNDQSLDSITDEIFFRSLFHKSASWSYEEEARVYGPQKAGTTLPFQSEELLTLILGPKTTKNLEEALTTTVSKLLPKLNIQRATLSKDGFNIELPNL